MGNRKGIRPIKTLFCCAATSVFLQLYLKPADPISFSRSLLQLFCCCPLLPLSAVMFVWQCCHHCSVRDQASSNFHFSHILELESLYICCIDILNYLQKKWHCLNFCWHWCKLAALPFDQTGCIKVTQIRIFLYMLKCLIQQWAIIECSLGVKTQVMTSTCWYHTQSMAEKKDFFSGWYVCWKVTIFFSKVDGNGAHSQQKTVQMTWWWWADIPTSTALLTILRSGLVL